MLVITQHSCSTAMLHSISRRVVQFVSFLKQQRSFMSLFALPRFSCWQIYTGICLKLFMKMSACSFLWHIMNQTFVRCRCWRVVDGSTLSRWSTVSYASLEFLFLRTQGHCLRIHPVLSPWLAHVEKRSGQQHTTYMSRRVVTEFLTCSHSDVWKWGFPQNYLVWAEKRGGLVERVWVQPASPNPQFLIAVLSCRRQNVQKNWFAKGYMDTAFFFTCPFPNWPMDYYWKYY